MSPIGPLDADRQALLEVLVARDVDFVLVGGAAAQTYGWRQDTQDVDVTPARDVENLKRLAAALNSLEPRFRVEDGPTEGFEIPGGLDDRTFLNARSIALTTRHGHVDVAMCPDGTKGYEELARDAIPRAVAQTEVRVDVAAPEAIVRSKTAANRLKDLEALPSIREALQRYRDDLSVIGARPPDDPCRQKAWDRAADAIADFRSTHAPSANGHPLAQRPTLPAARRAWDRAVADVAHARDHLRRDALPAPGELGRTLRDGLERSR